MYPGIRPLLEPTQKQAQWICFLEMGVHEAHLLPEKGSQCLSTERPGTGHLLDTSSVLGAPFHTHPLIRPHGVGTACPGAEARVLLRGAPS